MGDPGFSIFGYCVMIVFHLARRYPISQGPMKHSDFDFGSFQRFARDITWLIPAGKMGIRTLGFEGGHGGTHVITEWIAGGCVK